MESFWWLLCPNLASVLEWMIGLSPSVSLLKSANDAVFFSFFVVI